MPVSALPSISTAYDRNSSIHAVFAATARAFADRPALLTPQGPTTYAELDRLSIRVARALKTAGVQPGDRVAVEAERSAATVIAWLGILRCGAVYLPLDQAYPADALGFMMTDSLSAALLKCGSTDRGMPVPSGTAVLQLQSIIADASLDGQPWDDTRVDAAAPSYIMYTSGSTGRPKGVVVPHRGVMALVRDQNYMHFGPDEVYLLISALAFDVATWEIWGPLLNGGRLAILPGDRLSVDDISRGVQRFAVTSIYLTSALFNVIVDQDPKLLRGPQRIIVGGDVVSPEHSRRLVAALPSCELINGYGPTETTTFAVTSSTTCDPWGGAAVPIGRPLAHYTAYILDENLAPVPDGETGMLWIGGDGVAIGYHNRPELTQERFRRDPFSSDPHARMYMTGDLARLRPDRLIDYLGRIDRQVKVDGKRIELDEIEHAFRVDERVADVSVMLEQQGTSLDKRIVAFLKPRTPTEDPAWRTSVVSDYRARMPQHMVPHEIHVRGTFPLTKNGKVDRPALLAQVRPAPNATPTPVAPIPEPGTSLEETIHALWREALRGADSGPDDNFFDCGGTSMALVALHAKLQRAVGRDFPIADMFANTTLNRLTKSLAQTKPAAISNQAAERAQKQRAVFSRMRNTN